MGSYSFTSVFNDLYVVNSANKNKAQYNQVPIFEEIKINGQGL